jgi:endonuclease YncB( thermonuclease family)
MIILLIIGAVAVWALSQQRHAQAGRRPWLTSVPGVILRGTNALALAGLRGALYLTRVGIDAWKRRVAMRTVSQMVNEPIAGYRRPQQAIQVSCDGRHVWVRLVGIDLPERPAPGASRMRSIAQRWLAQGMYRVSTVYRDRDGLDRVMVERGSDDLAQILVSQGVAHAQRGKPGVPYREAEQIARMRAAGAWGASTVQLTGKV